MKVNEETVWQHLQFIFAVYIGITYCNSVDVHYKHLYFKIRLTRDSGSMKVWNYSRKPFMLLLFQLMLD